MKEHSINTTNTFVSGWYFDNLDICDKIIDYFLQHPRKSKGSISEGSRVFIDERIKNSLECGFENHNLRYEYYFELQKVCDAYINKYPFCNNYSSWNIVEDCNIQAYPKGGAFNVWHTERFSKHGQNSYRHLVFMTYLNTVSQGGETEFYHQNLCVKPEKGLTLIWPADWTHSHRGLPSPTDEKIIITGWYSFT